MIADDASLLLATRTPGQSNAQPSPADALACAHCGAPAGKQAELDAQGHAFCCAGCRTVFGILAECQLSDYYSERERLEAKARPARTTSHAYEEFDHPDFLSSHLSVDSSGMARLELALEGVHCAACVWLVERLPRVLPQVAEARLDFGRAIVSVRFAASELKPSRIARALDSLGYPPHALGSAARELEQTRADRALLLRLGIAFAAAGNVMLMSFALYSGALDTSEAAYGALFRWGSLGITLPTVAFSGSVFFRGAWAALRTRTPHMDLPVAIGILAGTLWGTVNTVLGRGEVYFDTLTVLIFLLLVGRWLGRRQQRQAARATELFAALAPATARLVRAGEVVSVPAKSVAVDDIVEVRPGERIPIDGVVVQGQSNVDAATLTGEARPIPAVIADRVFASTLNLDGVLRVRCEAAGDATRVGRLMHSVEQAQRDRPPIVKTADRVAGVLVFAVLGLALATALIWLFIEPSRAIDHAIALLVVTCPCALGMATPLSVSAALSRAANAGLLFKGGEFVEVLARPALFVLDKTGTLTEGRPELVAFDGPEHVKPWVRAAEARSEHPIARALTRAFAELEELEAENLRLVPGGGVVAQVAGHALVVGSRALVLAELGVSELPPEIEQRVQAYAARGATPVVIAVDGGVCATAALADRLRHDTAESLKQLERLGSRFLVLSGDHPEVVRETAEQLGVPLIAARGGLSPEQKHAEVARLRAQGERVVMVGDGVNDAAALSAATCGFAVHGGAEASLIAADVFATESGLRPLLRAVVGSTRALHTIRRGISFSLIYNLLGVGLAVSGLLTPLWAAVLMPLSSLTVVTNALKSRSFERT